MEHDHDAVLAAMRRNYTKGELLESEVCCDPIEQFEQWFADASTSGTREPNAMTLATAGVDGQPSARIVLLKALDARGFTFYTNYESRKGQELAQNPKAALVFYWPELERQVRVRGLVSRVDRVESEQYFHSRPTGSQIGAWASNQSRRLSGREELEQRYSSLESEFAGRTIPPPPQWGGYRLYPLEIEFWQGRTSRLHDRLLYTRAESGWRVERLAP